MACSPLLKGVTDPVEALRVLHETPVLGYSEPPQTFHILQEKGWVEYVEGHWCITEKGRKVVPRPDKKRAQTLVEFFEL